MFGGACGDGAGRALGKVRGGARGGALGISKGGGSVGGRQEVGRGAGVGCCGIRPGGDPGGGGGAEPHAAQFVPPPVAGRGGGCGRLRHGWAREAGAAELGRAEGPAEGILPKPPWPSPALLPRTPAVAPPRRPVERLRVALRCRSSGGGGRDGNGGCPWGCAAASCPPA